MFSKLGKLVPCECFVPHNQCTPSNQNVYLSLNGKGQPAYLKDNAYMNIRIAVLSLP